MRLGTILVFINVMLLLTSFHAWQSNRKSNPKDLLSRILVQPDERSTHYDVDDDVTNTSSSSSLPSQECESDSYPSAHWRGEGGVKGLQMFGTVAAQEAIWKAQHPSSCHDKKFVVYKATGRGHGMGSVLHKATVVLQVALDLNRILVLFPQPSGDWTDGRFCRQPLHGGLGMSTSTLDSCYFEPISSCSIYDAFGTLAPSDPNWEALPWLDETTYRANNERVLREDVGQFGSYFLFHNTPVMFHGMWRDANMSSHPNLYYWWRAQGAAYLVRPNTRTLLELDRRRSLYFNAEGVDKGTISVHVRHGDKWKESALASDQSYLEAVEALYNKTKITMIFSKGLCLQIHSRANLRAKSPNDTEAWLQDKADKSSSQLPEPMPRLKRKIFLSTEDAATVTFFANVAATNWTVGWTNVSRVSDNSTSPALYASLIGWDEEFLNSLLSLQLALECDAWVGMISSNWNRLIDELRSTVRCKYGHLYMDVFHGLHIHDYDW